MRYVLCFLSIAIAGVACAQTAFIVKKDSSKFEAVVTSHTDKYLFTRNERIAMEEINSVAFAGFSSSSQSRYDALRENGVKVRYDYVAGTGKSSLKSGDESKKVILVDAQTIQEASLAQLTKGLELYRRQSQTGKSLELFGLLAIGGSAIVQALNNQKYSDDLAAYVKNGSKGTVPTQSSVPAVVPIAGTLLMAVGIGIGIDARKHLIFK